ncbi:hypothetical protein JCM30237_24930 [Halolamina litorea]|uniref:Mechanosensitive ion channel n=1 Tax=Halolamina litorea TaxID=1515593 RepID=A0ABD6BTH4_9EURY|nr:hypothetical protein [Halolamina litorea]
MEQRNDGQGTESEEFPAYGPVEAVFGYILFYALVDRATPVVVDVLAGTGLSASSVRFGFAALLWFVLVVSVVDELRRQLAALGIGSYEPDLRVWSRVTPSSVRTAGYVAALVLGVTLASLTFDRAFETVLALLTLFVDGASISVLDAVATVVFFAAYGAATHSLDRLVIGVVRALTPR